MRRVRARYDAVLPPNISIARHPGHWNLAWNFGEIFRASFSRVWVCEGKFHQNFTSKTVWKTRKISRKFHSAGAQRWGNGESIFAARHWDVSRGPLGRALQTRSKRILYLQLVLGMVEEPQQHAASRPERSLQVPQWQTTPTIAPRPAQRRKSPRTLSY